MLQVINVLYLGRVDYSTGLELQKTLVHLVKEGRVGQTLLLLEHPPVITLGRNAGSSNIVASREFLESKGIEVVETNRGGDVTFHGPGQLVGYPIFDLRGFTPRLGAVDFVRKVEEALIRTCGDLGVPTERIAGLTGVWTQETPAAAPAAPQRAPAAPQRKIAAIGVHISRGVTSHGFALNVNTDLDFFKLIVPCGIADKPVTSLAREMESAGLKVPGLEQVAEMASRNFGRVFQAQTLWLDSLESLLRAAAPDEVPGPANQDTPAGAPEQIRKLAGEEDFHLA
ncbi:MAG TPA: lipoyl(octanoyl) transferase LipB [Terriglobales bacterium]|nr:lipoyl(octanoyl) transferase LipB [Terriglobales bacterium]